VFIDERCKYLVRDLEQVGLDTFGEIDKSNASLTHISDGFGYKLFRLYPIVERRNWMDMAI